MPTETALTTYLNKLKLANDTLKARKQEQKKSQMPNTDEGQINRPGSSIVFNNPPERLEEVKYVRKTEEFLNNIEQIIRRVHSLTGNQILKLAEHDKISLSGDKYKLRREVRNFYRTKMTQILKEEGMPTNVRDNLTAKHFEFLVVVDFEATCEELLYGYHHEIIEFPAVLVDVNQLKIIDLFHAYVHPSHNPQLDPFCVEFTGITQAQVNAAHKFPEVLLSFNQWMMKYRLGDSDRRYAFVTDGSHDLWKFFQYQCILSGFKSVPHHFRYWINIQDVFQKVTGHKLVKSAGPNPMERITSLMQMMAHYGLKMIGRAHSGIDDSKNIARVAIELMKCDRAELLINEKMTDAKNSFDQTDLLKYDSDNEDEIKHGCDMHIWLRRLPLKLQRLQRVQFFTGEYLDCESCDDLDEDND